MSRLDVFGVLEVLSKYIKLLVPSFSQLLRRLYIVENSMSVNQVSTDVAVGNLLCFCEVSIVVLERWGILYPVVKPGSFLGCEPLKVPREYRIVLELHTHPEPLYVPSSGDLRTLLEEYRSGSIPQYYGVSSVVDRVVVTSLINCEHINYTPLKETCYRVRKVEEVFKRGSRRVFYIPVPTVLLNYSLCGLSDRELLKLAMKWVHEISIMSDVRSTIDHVMSKFTSILSDLVRPPISGTVLSIGHVEWYPYEYLKVLTSNIDRVLKKTLHKRYQTYVLRARKLNYLILTT